MIKKFLLFPLKGSSITQTFGQDKTCTDTATGTKYKSKATDAKCPAGYVSLYQKMGMNGHNGIDMHAKLWQPIYASCDGWVEEVQTNEKVGLGVGVITNVKYFCAETGKEEYFKYRNWHFQAINIIKGQAVKTGDLLGWAGMTGYATGVHDHFELKPVAQDKKGKWYNVLQTNGYFGAIDPAPYLDSVPAIDINIYKKTLDTLIRALEELASRMRNTPKSSTKFSTVDKP